MPEPKLKRTKGIAPGIKKFIKVAEWYQPAELSTPPRRTSPVNAGVQLPGTENRQSAEMQPLWVSELSNVSKGLGAARCKSLGMLTS
ncbi:MAG: hypothetical protein V2I51_09520 [Anderseniella sp.]|nr:hypothetical protein [Anderseniella sp.]